MSEAKGVALPGRVVHADLLNLETVGICRALSELFGEKGWEVTWRSGEIVFEELKKELNITETEPLPLIQQISRWLVDVGYFDSIEVTQPSEDLLVYDIENPVPRWATERLRETNSVQPHFSATLMMAALRQMCGIEARMESVKSEFLSPTKSRQRWRLRPAGTSEGSGSRGH